MPCKKKVREIVEGDLIEIVNDGDVFSFWNSDRFPALVLDVKRNDEQCKYKVTLKVLGNDERVFDMHPTSETIYKVY
jgi:hypothetical protein